MLPMHLDSDDAAALYQGLQRVTRLYWRSTGRQIEPEALALIEQLDNVLRNVSEGRASSQAALQAIRDLID